MQRDDRQTQKEQKQPQFAREFDGVMCSLSISERMLASTRQAQGSDGACTETGSAGNQSKQLPTDRAQRRHTYPERRDEGAHPRSGETGVHESSGGRHAR